MKITKKSRDLVLYMTFGDGTINKNGGYLAIRHCVKQKEYIEWKRKLLIDNGINCTDIYYVSNNGYGAYEFRTYTHDFMKQMRRYLYTPKKDIANIKQLNKFNILGLYIWYLDDGGISQHKRNDKVVSNTLMINTMLTKEKNQIIIDYFLDRWNIKFRQTKNHGKYRLECGTVEARKFIKLIEPYAKEVECMSYKLNVKKEKSKFTL